MAFVVAFAGKIGSGKTTISAAVSQALGCKRASFGDYVREVVSKRGLPLTRGNLQRVGTEILEADRFEFCKNVLGYSGWSQGDSLVIDGLRHSETIPLLKHLLRPAELRIAYVDIQERSRVKRLGIRGDEQLAALTSTDAHPSEQQVATALRKVADLIVDGEQPIEHCVATVLDWIAKL